MPQLIIQLKSKEVYVNINKYLETEQMDEQAIDRSLFPQWDNSPDALNTGFE